MSAAIRHAIETLRGELAEVDAQRHQIATAIAALEPLLTSQPAPDARSTSRATSKAPATSARVNKAPKAKSGPPSEWQPRVLEALRELDHSVTCREVATHLRAKPAEYSPIWGALRVLAQRGTIHRTGTRYGLPPRASEAA